MKANEAPEKIYVHVRANKELGTTWHGTWIGVHDIEYTRTDAIIEKVCEFIEQNITSYIDVTHYGGDENIILQNEFIEDFKNFIKGE